MFRLAHALLAACSGRTATTHRGTLDAATRRWPQLLDLHAVAFTSTPPTAAVVGGTYTPTATGRAFGQPMTLGATGTCSLDGANVTFTGAGAGTITANQAGTADYTAAPRSPRRSRSGPGAPGSPTR